MTISKKYNRIAMLMLFIGLLIANITYAAYPVSFQDSSGKEIKIIKKPVRVISLVPGITEIIAAIGAGDSVIGITYHDTELIEANKKTIVGGFFSPALHRINSLSPDMIFYSTLHNELKNSLINKPVIMINLESHSIADIYHHIELLGMIFDKNLEAEKIIQKIKTEIANIQHKVKNIPESKRKRIIRIMGADNGVMAPGDDSFQNEYIRLAGGIAPKLNKNGGAVPVSLEEWKTYNPEIIYDCGKSRTLHEYFIGKAGWNEADAVKNKHIYYFPCDLTCRASIHAGEFISWLSATIYPDQFLDKQNRLNSDNIISSRTLSIDLYDWASARIIDSIVNDFNHSTLLLELNPKMKVLSTLEGMRNNIHFVGNCYSPPPTWVLYHNIGLDKSRDQLYDALKLDKKETSLLFTGADMNHLAVSQKSYKQMQITAFVTAGVESNAVRMSKDAGAYYEPGTINIILISNMKLSDRAMTRAVITSTEAKTAAMEDLDIRSAYTGVYNSATGTGTDNIIVVEGSGTPIDNSGGHTKMGELIAKAVYEGVINAVLQQNGIFAGRSLFSRLQERNISIHALLNPESCECKASRREWIAVLEDIFLTPRYEGFIETAFTISDDFERGLITDISLFQNWCDSVAKEIAGDKPLAENSVLKDDSIPTVIRMALNAVIQGAISRLSNE